MDKQDELAGAVQEVLPHVHLLVSDGSYREASEQIAKAVRSYLMSDEVVERAAAILFRSETVGGHWCDLCGNEREAYRDSARAALSAAGGGGG